MFSRNLKQRSACRFNFTHHLVALIYLMVCAATGSSKEVQSGSIDFNRDIRPLLSDNCFQCHGPDAEQLQAVGRGSPR
jgi:hypothetical protein